MSWNPPAHPDQQSRRASSLFRSWKTSVRTRATSAQRRRTRIVATIGPASASPEMLEALVAAGMDVARVSFAHSTIADAISLMQKIRRIAPHIGILPDLPGPKIRSSTFPKRGVVLEAGAELVLAPSSKAPTSTALRIGVALDEAVASLDEGDLVSLGDGGISLVVLERRGDEVLARVRSGGRVVGRPGVTVPSHKLALATPTPEDFERIRALVAEEVEAIAVSFVRRAEDIEAVREAVGDPATMLVAKIETAEAIDNLDAIVRSADAVMVARGDLGIRLPLEDVPFHQKDIIRCGVRFARPVITATQMLESMITSPVPTRAEVSDVANAILDGTSAVMLSGETAIGADPVNVVATMSRIVERGNRALRLRQLGCKPRCTGGFAHAPLRRITAAITGAAWHAALEEDVAAIIAYRSPGRHRHLALSPRDANRRCDAPRADGPPALDEAGECRPLSLSTPATPTTASGALLRKAVEAGFATPGDVVVVIGSPYEKEPVADTLRLVRIR